MEDTRIYNRTQPVQTPGPGDALHREWFEVSGDLDDFIFFGEDGANVSER